MLVNNAGANWAAPLADFGDAAWNRVLDLNVKGVFHLTVSWCRPCRRGRHAGDPARVINIGSIDGLHAPEFETYSYSASKAAVHHLTRTLAKRLAREGITVNAIAPGPFESKMMAATLDALRRCRSGHNARSAGSASPRTWLGPRSSSPRGGRVPHRGGDSSRRRYLDDGVTPGLARQMTVVR